MRALVLSGGSSKGAYQVGALQHVMGEEGRDYEILCGVSVGAINTSVLSQFPLGSGRDAINALLDLWARVDGDNVKRNWFLGEVSALWKQSVYDSRPLQKWIESGLDASRIASSGKALRVGVTSWRTGMYRFATEADPQISKWVVASSSYPVFLLPIEIDGELWTDGGLCNVTPLGEAIRLGADEIDVIMCSNPDREGNWDWRGKAAVPGFTIRTLDIMSDEITRADLKECGLKNDIAELNGKYRKVKVRLLQPSRGLGVDAMDFSQESVRKMMSVGREDAVSGWQEL